MRILLAPVGTEGDVRPFATLASALARAGHEPLLLVAPDFAELCRGVGADPIVVGDPFRPRMESLARCANGRPWTAWRALLRGLREGVCDQFRLLAPHVDGVDLFVGTALQFSIHSFADRAGVPSCQIGHVPTLVPSRYHAPPMIPRSLGIANPLAWSAVFLSLQWALRRTMDRQRALLGMSPIRGAFRDHFRRPFLLAMDPELAPLASDVPPAVAQCGYPRDPDSQDLSGEVEAFLSAGDPPVYIGFGSMVDDNATGLAQTVRQAVHLAGTRAIVSRGWSGLAAKDDRILSVGHVPHSRLFPRCAAVVHHGGAGTSWSVSRAGVPHVVVPHLMDQPWWARRLSTMGLGARAVDHARLNPHRLAASIREAVGMDRTRCRNLSQTLAQRDGATKGAMILASWARGGR